MADPNTPQEKQAPDPPPGMMGDGTEEQNLGQPGNPAARISEDEVAEAFDDKEPPTERKPRPA